MIIIQSIIVQGNLPATLGREGKTCRATYKCLVYTADSWLSKLLISLIKALLTLTLIRVPHSNVHVQIWAMLVGISYCFIDKTGWDGSFLDGQSALSLLQWWHSVIGGLIPALILPGCMVQWIWPGCYGPLSFLSITFIAITTAKPAPPPRWPHLPFHVSSSDTDCKPNPEFQQCCVKWAHAGPDVSYLSW